MNAWALKRGLTAVIVLLTRTHPSGNRVLLGEYSPPDADEVSAMLGALGDPPDPEMRVDGGVLSLSEAIRVVERVDRFDEIVQAAGGWEHIAKAAREWSRHYAVSWGVVKDHAMLTGASAFRVDGSQIEKIAAKHGICERTVYRLVSEFPGELAAAILRSTDGPYE
jgi:hypothetical protein